MANPFGKVFDKFDGAYGALDTGGGGVPALPVPEFTTFDPAGADSTRVLSNTNRTVTNPTGNAANGLIRTRAHFTTGKYAWDVVVGAPGIRSDIGGADAGLALSAGGSGAGLPNKANAFCVTPDGNVYGGTSFATIGNLGVSYTAGDTLNFAVDMATKKLWVRKNGAGNWNASGTANPATGVGGLTLPAGITDLHIAFTLMAGGAATIQDAAAKPSGFGTLYDLVDINFIIGAGQSNLIAQQTDTSYSQPRDPNVLTWNGSALVEFQPGVVTGVDWGTPTGKVGSEAELIRLLRLAEPLVPVALAKFGASGSSLASDGTFDWSDNGELADTGGAFVAACRAALIARGYNPIVRLLCWIQGENDAVTDAKALAYGTNLAALVAKWRNASLNWKIGSAPIAIVRLSSQYGSATNRNNVRAGQKSVTDANTGGPAWLVNVDDGTLEADNTHWVKSTVIMVGGRFYLVIAGTYVEPTNTP